MVPALFTSPDSNLSTTEKKSKYGFGDMFETKFGRTFRRTEGRTNRRARNITLSPRRGIKKAKL